MIVDKVMSGSNPEKANKYAPKVAVWEITFKCNMNCLHCGTSAGQARQSELTTDEALRLCDELAQLGCRQLTLSGGEPLLRQDWTDIARRLKSNGIQLGLITNGYLMTRETAAILKEIGFGTVGVSFDGNEEVHNQIRRNPDSFDRVISAFGHLREAGLYTCGVSQISRHNLGALEEMRQILIKNGVNSWQLQMTMLTGRMRDESQDYILRGKDLAALADYIVSVVNKPEIKVITGENIGYYNHQEKYLRDGFGFGGCHAGLRVIGIESNGNIKGCLSMPEDFVEGNIRERSLTEIWNDPKAFSYNRNFTPKSGAGFCRDCQYFENCRGGCGCTAYASSGNRYDNLFCLYRIEEEGERSRGAEVCPERNQLYKSDLPTPIYPT